MFDYPVVFVDIETTGGSYRNSRVLEIAAIRYENGKVTAEMSTLVNPQSYIPPMITSLTGITPADIIDAPLFEDIADEFMEIMDGAIFVAHNVKFDYSFIKSELSLLGVRFSPKLLCTVRLSRALYAEQKGHSLAVLIERHQIPFQKRHRALDDARAILYFSQLAFDTHGQEMFDAAIVKQLRTQSLPANLNMEELESIGNVPGVYIFEDELHQPLYVGKSITLKKRILSHFQDTAARELKMSQHIHHVRTIPTGSELAALILESKLVKELQPLYNRRLRRISSYAILTKDQAEGYATISIRSGSVNAETDTASVYGLYESRTQAKHQIDYLTRLFGLCPKRMGIEKTNGACFSYALGKCKGACVGEEAPDLYNRRFEIALEKNKLQTWPYAQPIGLPVGDDMGGVVIDNWMIVGFYTENPLVDLQAFEGQFDVDEYKIIRQFIRQNKHAIVPITLID